MNKPNYIIFLKFRMDVLRELAKHVISEEEREPTISETFNKHLHKNGEVNKLANGKVDMSNFDYSKIKPSLMLRNNVKEFYIISNAKNPKKKGKKIIRAIGKPVSFTQTKGKPLTYDDISNAAAFSKLNSPIPDKYLDYCDKNGLEEIMLEITNTTINIGKEEACNIGMRLVLPKTKEEILSEINSREK